MLNEFGIEFVSQMLNKTHDAARLTLKYQLVVHQLLFASSKTLRKAQIYIKQWTESIKKSGRQQLFDTDIKQVLVDLNRMLIDSDSEELAESVAFHKSLLYSLPNIRGKTHFQIASNQTKPYTNNHLSTRFF